MPEAASRLQSFAEQLLGVPLPMRIRAWDGSQAGPPGAPTVVVRNRRALRRLLWKPGELGLARAWVAGDLDIEGDFYAALDLLSGLVWDRGEDARSLTEALREPEARAAVRGLVKMAGLPVPPAPPREEVPRRRRQLHTKRTDKRAVSHHYDVGNDFYALVLGPSMVYSCAYWEAPGDTPDGTTTLEAAQRDKLELICRKLALTPGLRLLDVGCGWGSLAIHAAREHGVHVVGVTLSQEQATYARKRVADQGLTDRVEIRVQDYRDVTDGPFDAVSSVGMAEHVGSEQYLTYARDLYALLKPGGRLLNHQIARRPEADEGAYSLDGFIDAYVFPDGELAPVGTTVTQLERAGFEVRDVESIREHYALTLRQWVTSLEADWRRAQQLTSPGRARVWRLYMAACALAFEHNRLGVNQVLAVRTPESGASGLPLRARTWN
ncbi:cyclopropane-fatty-acyl-phospholipid synthase family protein [Streptomyces sp. NBC_00576]|uniref:cyclopropane-fatty-acyl-phospholipid synthase family protein n=1 Tax=Streptomyces sp. NBC_00576 TaxID=2903665 RepID=UPI002E8200AD|nr:cyclopropane-fatty-acyl-phospholipid synthase family protein [Streptomyces sp. NBC_00576]WUB71833.1 cyclopropane-fatty-acyl-phospholipid synthase family protein [Streptomyces sp. NBC_00576]